MASTTKPKKSEPMETKPETRNAFAHEIILSPDTQNAVGRPLGHDGVPVGSLGKSSVAKVSFMRYSVRWQLPSQGVDTKGVLGA